MQIMVDKGQIERRDVNRSHVYRPLIGRDDTRRKMAGHLLNRVFGGSARELLVGALGARAMSTGELDELKDVIDRHKKGRKK